MKGLFKKKSKNQMAFWFVKNQKSYFPGLTIGMLVFLFMLFVAPRVSLATDDPYYNRARGEVESSMHIETDSTSGSFIYDYPLVIPPGRYGLQPNLSLSYNNQSTELSSIFGQGWNLNIPYIERVNREGSEDLYSKNYFYSSMSGELKLISSGGQMMMASLGQSEQVASDTNIQALEFQVSPDLITNQDSNQQSLTDKVIEKLDNSNDKVDKTGILQEYQLKVDKKSDILDSKIVDWIAKKEDGTLENKGKIMEYDYISKVKVEAGEIEKDGKKIKEDVSKRTSNARFYQTGVSANGKLWLIAQLYPGKPFIKKDNDWYHTETATTTIEDYNGQTKDNLISRIFGLSATANTDEYYAGSGDGTVFRNRVSSWSNARGDSTTEGTGSRADSSVLIDNADGYGLSSRFETNVYNCVRTFLPIDTSSLPDNAEIADANLNLYALAWSFHESYPSSSYSYVAIVQTTQPSVTSLSVSDYHSLTVDNPTKGSANFDFTNFNTDGYVSIPLNSTGLGWINTEGYTKLGVRNGQDIENHAEQSNVDSLNANTIWLYSSRQTGTNNDPYLEVEYTLMGNSPSSPDNLLTEGSTNPIDVLDSAPEFSAIYNDLDTSDYATHYQIQVSASSTNWTNLTWDSGKVMMATTTEGTRSPDISYGGTPFSQDGSTYYWRIKFWDNGGSEGAWSTGDDYFRIMEIFEYGVKIDNGDFVKYNNINNEYWTVTDKKGTVYKFGYATTTRQYDSANSTRIFKWMLEEVRDKNGNYVKYEYYKDNGQIYPYKINYTGHDSTDGDYEVEFLRESRSDNVAQNYPGFRVKTNYRINEIQVKMNGSWVKKYELDYATGDNGIKSLLDSITESGKDESNNVISLPADNFDYQTKVGTWSQNTSYSIPEDFVYFDQSDFGVRLADVNGDGLTDIIKAQSGQTRKVYINNGNGTGWTYNSNYVVPFDFVWSGFNDFGVRVVDVNGDGLADMIRADSTNRKVYINNGNGTGWTEDTNYNFPVGVIGANGLDNGSRMVDVNGDGLIDIVYAEEGYAKKVYINKGDGTGWAENSNYSFPTYIVYDRYSNNHPKGVLLADINGDGLVDVLHSEVNASGTTNEVYINKGDGMGWVQDTNYYIPVLFGNYGSDTFAQLIDVNGDGLTDIVTNSQTTYINKGDGTGWTQNTNYTIPLGFASGATRLADVNGDGLDDFLYSTVVFNSNGSNYSDRRVYIANGKKADSLTQVNHSKGAVTKVNYKGSAESYNNGVLNPKLPYSLQVVDKLVVNDGLGNIATSTYEYYGGSYYYGDEYDRRLAGFNKVEKIDGAGNKIKTYYHQGNETSSTYGEFADDQSKIGRIYRTEVYDASDNLYSKTINKWVNVDLGNDRDFVMLTQSVSSDYDGDATHRDKASTYVYDDTNGNLQQTINYGEVSGSDNGSFTDMGTDLASTTIEYAASTTLNIIGLPKREITQDQNNNKVKETKYYYDSLSYGDVNKGNPTKTEYWKSGTSYINSQKSYNNYGLVTQETDPRGKVTSYSYDTYNLYPASVTNAKNQTTNYLYDYSCGKAKKVTDPNNSIRETVYDGLDRVVTEKQSDINSPSTELVKAEYVYNNTSSPRSITKTNYLDGTLTNEQVTYLNGLDQTIQDRKQSEDVTTFAVKDYSYNKTGLLKSESLPYFSSGNTYTSATSTANLFSNYTYDALGRVLSVINSVGTTTTAYDNWKTKITDANGQVKDLYKDANNNLVRVDEHVGENIENTYNSLNTNSAGFVSTSSQSMSINNSNQTGLNLPNNNTFEFWVKLSSTPATNNTMGLIAKDDISGAQRSYSIWYGDEDGTKRIAAYFFQTLNASQYSRIAWPITLNPGTWYHVAIATNLGNTSNSKAKLYINGVDKGNGEAYNVNGGANSIASSSAPVELGRFSGLYFNGKIDDVRIWNTVRTSTEISNNFQKELAGNETGLVAYWKLNGNGNDSSGHVNNLTNNNGASYVSDVPFTDVVYTTVYDYDLQGDLKKITDANGNIRNFTYDGLKRLLTSEDLHTSTDSSYGVTSFTYDDAGNVITKVDPNNNTINYTYDDLNRNLTEDNTGTSGTEVTNVYDNCTNGVGYLCSASTASVASAYTYNGLGQVNTETKTINNNQYSTTYDYDRQGNLVNITYPDNAQVQYTYNNGGQIEKIQQKEDGGSYFDIVSNYDYNPMGQVVYELLGNNVSTEYVYDADELYRLKQKKTMVNDNMQSSLFEVPSYQMLLSWAEKSIRSDEEIPEIIVEEEDKKTEVPVEDAEELVILPTEEIPQVVVEDNNDDDGDKEEETLSDDIEQAPVMPEESSIKASEETPQSAIKENEDKKEEKLSVSSKYEKSSVIKNKYALEKGALIKKAKDKNDIEVRVGDENRDDLVPELNISKWDREVNFKIKPKDSENEGKDMDLGFDDKVIKFKNQKKEYHFYDIDKNENYSEGAYEFEVILNEKPESNEVKLDIETDNLVFYYQPYLEDMVQAGQKIVGTEIFDEAGNLVMGTRVDALGSYAAYYKDKKGDYSQLGGKNYKTGKAFHIFRPKIKDAVGNWVWGEFNRDLNETHELVITVPQEFLDKAVYPVTVDPTFGYTGEGYNYDIPDDMIVGNIFTPGYSGYVTKMNAFVSMQGNNRTKTAIYKSDLSLLGYSSEITGYHPDYEWKQYLFSSSPHVLDISNYYLLFWGHRDQGYGAYIRFDQGATYYSKWQLYGSWTDPITLDTGVGSRIYSMYATYTVPTNPTVTTGVAEKISSGTEKLYGDMNIGQYQDVDLFFNYGLTENLGATTTPITQATSTPFYQNVFNLNDLELYNYRIGATDNVDYWYGNIEKFFTGDVATTTYKSTQWNASSNSSSVIANNNKLQLNNASSGYWISRPLDLDSISNVSNSKIKWSALTPASTTVSVYTGINSSATTPPSSWDLATSSSAISNASGDLTGKYLWTKIVMTSNIATSTPEINWIAYGINDSGASSITTLQDLYYTYDNVGNITNIIDLSDTKTNKVIDFGYDYLNRLTRASTTSAVIAGFNQTYTYDPIGNIMNKSDIGNYVYGNTNYANPHAATQIASTTFTYDNNGNMTNDGIWNNTWDYRNRLTQSTKTSSTIRYTYDDQDQRILYSVNGTATTTTVNSLYEITGATSTKYIYANDQLISTINGTDLFFNHNDHLSGSNVITSASGTVAELLDYYPFGSIRLDEKSVNFNEHKKFTGHEYDADTGLNYMKARYQSGTIARFISVDSESRDNPEKFLADPQQMNTYSYSRNNPMLYVDPDGRTPVILGIMVGGALAGAGGQAVSDVISGKFSGWQAYTSAAIGGAAGAPAAMISPLLGGVVTGLVSETSKQTMSSISNKQNEYNLKGIEESVVLGAITSKIPAPMMQGVNVGQGSMEAITKQVLTKSAQGQINNVSIGTLAKIGVYTVVSNSGGNLAGGVLQARNANKPSPQNCSPIGSTISSANKNNNSVSNNSSQSIYSNKVLNTSFYSGKTSSVVP